MVVNERIIATSGNQAVYGNNLDVFQCPDGYYDTDTGTILVKPGQPVVWSRKTGKSLNAASVVNYEAITVSVGKDTNGDGISDVLISVPVDEMRGHWIKYANSTIASWGQAAIKFFSFGCTEWGDPHSIAIEVEDNDTHNLYPNPWKNLRWVYTVDPSKTGCSTCTVEDNCAAIQCAFVDAINGDTTSATCKILSGNKVLEKKRPIPVTAVRLYNAANSFKVFCLDPVAGKPGYVDGINSIDYTDNDAAPQTFTTTGYLDADGDLSYAQLRRLAKKLNSDMGQFGYVSVAKGAGNGPAQLIISSCLTGIVVDDTADSPITPCDQSNPLAAFSVTNDCVSCGGSETGTHQHTCGFAVIADEVKIKCDCTQPVNWKQTLYRKVSLYPSGDNWVDYRIQDYQFAQAPKGLGYFWQHREWAQDTGGPGRSYYEFDDHLGVHGTLSDDSRSKASITTDCNDAYCVLAIGTRDHHNGGMPFGNDTSVDDAGIILIPDADTTTQTGVLAILNAWFAAKSIETIDTLACS